MKNLSDKVIGSYAKFLADKGYRLIHKAFETSEFSHIKTQNLRDSYGSAVFYKRRLVQGTMRFMNPMADTPKFNKYESEYQYGRGEIIKFFNEYEPTTDNLVLVIAVAMFYGKVLESGKGLTRKYRVISTIDGDIDSLASQLNGRVNRINH